MKNKVLIYGLLAGASFLAYKHYTKKKLNEMAVVDEIELPKSKLTKEEEIYLKEKRQLDKLRSRGGKIVKVPVSSQTIRL